MEIGVPWTTVDPDARLTSYRLHPLSSLTARGLSKAMMARAMTRLAQSHSGAVLGTSSGRLGAVKVYLDFGFRPEPGELDKPEIVQAWRDVRSVIGHAALEQWLPGR